MAGIEAVIRPRTAIPCLIVMALVPVREVTACVIFSLFSSVRKILVSLESNTYYLCLLREIDCLLSPDLPPLTLSRVRPPIQIVRIPPSPPLVPAFLSVPCCLREGLSRW